MSNQPADSQATILSADITYKNGSESVWVVIAGGDGQAIKLFEYYSDEISFSPSEFVGKTVPQARALRRGRDTDYLRGSQYPIGTRPGDVRW